MKEILKKNFDNIFCINLNERKDKWNHCKEEFKKYNILDLVERYPAINYKKDPSRVRSITTSHINVIKLAKERQYDNVLIFEDDFKFINYKYVLNSKEYNPTLHDKNVDGFGLNRVPSNPEEILKKALTQLKQYDWDILFFGCQINIPKKYAFYKKINKNLFQASGMTRAHAYAVNSKVYDFIIDNDSSKYRYILDKLIKDYLSHVIKCVVISPIICTQNSNLWSDRKNGTVQHAAWTDKMLKTYYCEG